MKLLGRNGWSGTNWVLAGLLLTGVIPVFGAEKIPEELKSAQITEKLGAQVSLDSLRFKKEDGTETPLKALFRGKPVILTPVYYNCPNLCNFLLNGLNDSLKGLKAEGWEPGKQFDIISFSINPLETPELAAGKKKNYLKALGNPDAGAGWHFLTGDEATIRQLADQVGFGYRYDEKTKEYAHSAALIFLSPEGKITRYLANILFPPRDVKLSLLEAGRGTIGTLAERAVLFCFRYDPHEKGYSLYVMRLVRVFSALTLGTVGFYLYVFWSRQRRRTDVITS